MRVTSLLFARKREIERLFSVSAAAFGVPLPPPASRTAGGRLREFECFTSVQAAHALRHPERRSQIEQKLFRGAFLIGSRLRLQLRVRSPREAMLATRLVYRGLGIDSRGLAFYRELCFRGRITEGESCCTACLARRTA